jgi:PIN domain nuclease of toxin-antitoxin system
MAAALLATAPLISWATGQALKLSPRVQAAIATALGEGQLLVSAISAWELGALGQEGRLALTMALEDWWATLALVEGLQVLPITAPLALAASQLPGNFPGKLSDRLLVA